MFNSEKNLSSESFEKILNENIPASFSGHLLSSEDKGQKNEKIVNHFSFKKDQIIENKYKVG